MRLIDTQTLELCESFDTLPRYAILSHRWGKDEVNFQEMQQKGDRVVSKTGFKKIQRFCQIALKSGCKYGWVDTCCINKADPTELAEAINSMFRWYQSSEVCIVYLSDVFLGLLPRFSNTGFKNSQWFTRGWTLQELLAPTAINFYSADWRFISTKKGCLEALSDITTIPTLALEDRSTLGRYSIAQKMSWAAKRETTKVEDIAYCLLGIFDVSMPLIYGEGQKAFVRLQREIMQNSDDQSILAWTTNDISLLNSWPSALTPAPCYFESASNVERFMIEG